MKKLNRKGFTLIELLAVIVIMAIILIVTVPNIINSISDARVSSIHNLAVSAANTYNTAYAQDLVASDENKVLGNLSDSVTSTWKCIGSITDGSKTLAGVLGLTETDVVLNQTDTAKVATDTATITSEFCSSIRLNNGSVEVILVAADGGKFDVSGKTVYAYSKDAEAVVK